MTEPTETWADRFVREVKAGLKLTRQNPLLGAAFIALAVGYFWLTYFDSNAKHPQQAAWIYVGTRMQNTWQTSEAEGIEPAVILSDKGILLKGLPEKGRVYTVTNEVHLRDTAPELTPDKSAPVMSASIGTIQPGSTVKVDAVKQVAIVNPDRSWVWAHITVLVTQ